MTYRDCNLHGAVALRPAGPMGLAPKRVQIPSWVEKISDRITSSHARASREGIPGRKLGTLDLTGTKTGFLPAEKLGRVWTIVIKLQLA